MDHSPDDNPPPSSLRHDADARLPAAACVGAFTSNT